MDAWEALARYCYDHERMVREDYPPFDELTFREASERIAMAQGSHPESGGSRGWLPGLGQAVTGRSGLLFGPKVVPEEVVRAGRAIVNWSREGSVIGPRMAPVTCRGARSGFRNFCADMGGAPVIHLLTVPLPKTEKRIVDIAQEYGVSVKTRLATVAFLLALGALQ